MKSVKNLPRNIHSNERKSKPATYRKDREFSSRDYAQQGMPVPYAGMRNHNFSEKELGTVDRGATAYERSNKWVNQASGGGYDFYKKQAKAMDFRNDQPREVKSNLTTQKMAKA